MEFSVAVWNPYLEGDIKHLEGVQRRATKIPHSSKNLSYEERCGKLCLTSLSVRRDRGDMIQKFKVDRNLDVIKWVSPPKVVSRNNRRPQIRKEIVKNCNQRYHFFTNRIANNWNSLPDNVINAIDVNDFKTRLGKHLHRAASQGIKHF